MKHRPHLTVALLALLALLPASAWAQGCVGTNGINTIANCPPPTSLLLTDKVATYQNVQTPHTRAATWADISALIGAGGGGAAGGDLSGTYPNPTVARINGGALGTTTPTSANVLIGSGSAWVTHAFSGDWTIGNTGVATLATVNSNTGTWGDGTHVGSFTVNGKGLITAASSVVITGAAPTGSAGGDLTGTYPNPTLATVNSNTGTWGDGTHVGAFTVNGKGLITAASSVAITGAAPSGSAGGDLGGTYPNPTVVAVGNVTGGVLGATHGGAGTVTGALKGNGAGTVSQAACADLSNGATGCSTATGTSGGTIPLLNGTNVWSGQQSVTPVTLAISTATYTPTGASNNYSITLVHASCPCTLANPSATPVAGTGGQIMVIQSATGSDTIGTWGSQYEASGGTSTLTLSTGVNAVDILSYYVRDATHIELSLLTNFSH